LLIGGTPYIGAAVGIGCSGFFGLAEAVVVVVVVGAGFGSSGWMGGGPYAGAVMGSVVFVGAGGGLSVGSFPHAVNVVAAAAANVSAARAKRRSFGSGARARSTGAPIAASQNGHAVSFARTCRAQPGQVTSVAMPRASHGVPPRV
jgi:hypothetical protein